MKLKILLFVIAVLSIDFCFSAFADDTEKNAPQKDAPASQPLSDDAIPEVFVFGRSEDLLGEAVSASQGHVGAAELQDRPLLRPAEVLETIPGLIVTQHSGAGKANQYFLRGFNLDHGTDFATSIDGMPVNLPTHAHGQGYTDLNFLIPELVEYIDYKKGPYFAENGDLSSVGSADIHLVDRLDKGLAQATTGSYGYNRILLADSPLVNGNPLLYALEAQYFDGPFDRTEQVEKVNGLLKYSSGTPTSGATVTFSAYHNQWNSPDQIPQRAVDENIIGDFGAIDPSDGGYTTRFSLFGDWRDTDKTSSTKVNFYSYLYTLKLYNDFTYFLEDPINGDQFEQKDRRVGIGAKASHDWHTQLAGFETTYTAGVETRNDFIPQIELNKTHQREYLSTVSDDSVIEDSASLYGQNEIDWLSWFRTITGLRGDLFHISVDSDVDANSGDETRAIASPKFQAIFGPWDKTEFYFDFGTGFHSNDARGVTIQVQSTDPTKAIDPGSLLVRSTGGEVGVRSSIIPNLNTTLSFWILNFDSELDFSGDAGDTEPSGPTHRHGIELANFYKPVPWLSLDADWSLSQARYTDSPSGDNYVPEAIESALNTGVNADFGEGFYGELRYRLFGPRALVQDDSVRSRQTALFEGELGYRYQQWTTSLDLLNILGQDGHDIDYYYTSRLPGEPAAGVNDDHFHPTEPREIRLTVAYRF